jgi:hypothetical protein
LTVFERAPLAVADFNNDGIPDLQVQTYNLDAPNGALIWLGKGDGTFPVQLPLNLGVSLLPDLNGDGILDGFETNGSFSANQTTILLGDLTTTTKASVGGVAVPGGGIHHVYASTMGDANHVGGTSPKTWAVAGTPITTATSLSVSPGTTAAHGTTVQFTAAITPGEYANYTASGVVTFYNGTTAIARGMVTNGQAVYSTNSLAVGFYHLTAVYPGDANFTASTSPVVPLTVK